MPGAEIEVIQKNTGSQ